MSASGKKFKSPLTAAGFGQHRKIRTATAASTFTRPALWQPTKNTPPSKPTSGHTLIMLALFHTPAKSITSAAPQPASTPDTSKSSQSPPMSCAALDQAQSTLARLIASAAIFFPGITSTLASMAGVIAELAERFKVTYPTFTYGPYHARDRSRYGSPFR